MMTALSVLLFLWAIGMGSAARSLWPLVLVGLLLWLIW